MDSTKKVIAPRRKVIEVSKKQIRLYLEKRWHLLTMLKLECGHKVFRRVAGKYAECKACPKVAPGQRDHAPLSK